MSGATYRIEVEYDPHATLYFWNARIVRLSDGQSNLVYDATKDEAIRRARAWIAAERNAPPAPYLYVDDEGRDVPIHSVKA